MNSIAREEMGLAQKCLALIVIALFGVFIVWLTQKPTMPEQIHEEVLVEVPEEFIFALANLEGDVGTSIEQRKDIYTLAEALRIGVISSRDLGKKSNWLTEFRHRVDVREATEAWEELKQLETKLLFDNLSKQELAKVPRLRKFIEFQIYSQYAVEEGLTCNHAQVGHLVSHITQK